MIQLKSADDEGEVCIQGPSFDMRRVVCSKRPSSDEISSFC